MGSGTFSKVILGLHLPTRQKVIYIIMEYIKGKDLFQYICSLEKWTECKASQNILLDKEKVYHLIIRILKFYMIILKKQNMKC